ncbi:MAG TPA: FAD-binding oxidoreductase [Dermatophilaceae bacterium]|nr:FAD-binding oxidoreductase [Dermatophilaceae bacterium]
MTPVEHAAAVRALQASFDAIPPAERVRLAKRTSNLFRPRTGTGRPWLDVSGLTRVISVDEVGLTADVQGMTTYEDLVDVTLAHGCMPLVVPQLKTITLGGAVTGLGIESTSFRNGLPHESVLELDVLTGGGSVVTATADNEHADLFRAFPNSYGSLGYATRVRIELERVHQFVRLRHVRFHDLARLVATVGEVMRDHAYAGQPVDFVDGVVFTATESYLVLGNWADTAPYCTSYDKSLIYYRSIQQRPEDYLRVRDYLWRWDTDWFWCSRAFGAQRPRMRRLWPKRWLRSEVYWKLIAVENRYHLAARLDAHQGRPPRERVVQDVEVPLERTAEFLHWFLDHVPIEPIWLCPLRLRDEPVGASDASPAGKGWPLYPLQPGRDYVNVGFWSTVEIAPGARDGDVNRAVEAKVGELGGHKSLYSDAYYDPKAFWLLYGGATYDKAKARYDPDGRLTGLYDKAVRRT